MWAWCGRRNMTVTQSPKISSSRKDKKGRRDRHSPLQAHPYPNSTPHPLWSISPCNASWACTHWHVDDREQRLHRPTPNLEGKTNLRTVDVLMKRVGRGFPWRSKRFRHTVKWQSWHGSCMYLLHKGLNLWIKNGEWFEIERSRTSTEMGWGWMRHEKRCWRVRKGFKGVIRNIKYRNDNELRVPELLLVAAI